LKVTEVAYQEFLAEFRDMDMVATMMMILVLKELSLLLYRLQLSDRSSLGQLLTLDKEEKTISSVE
jgi:hypothetical protein